MSDAALNEAIDELLGLDAAELADDDLHDLVITVQRQSHRLAALRAQLISAWDQRGGWSSDGSRSPAHRLAREASTSVAAAKIELRRARALRTMPSTAAAVASGALSPQHIDLFADASSGTRAACFERDEHELVEQCTVLRFADARRMVEYWKQHADASATEDDGDRLDESRPASASTTFEGMVDLRAWLDPTGGAAVSEELARLTEMMRREDRRDGHRRSAAQRRADALVEMAHRSRTAHAGGLRPRPLLTILVGESSFSRICELSTGTVVAPGQIVPWLVRGGRGAHRVRRSEPGHHCVEKRSFTGALRRAIEVRDRHCQHPSGCDEPASRCDVDHITPYSEGGDTSQENGRLECWPHNRIEHLRNAGPGVPMGDPLEPDEPDGHDDVDPAPGALDEADGRAPPDAA